MSTAFAYREQYALLPLTDWVRKFWVLDNGRNPAPVHNKNVLPNSCFNLAYVTGEGLLIHNRRGPLALPAASYFCGQARGSVDVVIQPRIHAVMHSSRIGIRFLSWLSYFGGSPRSFR